MRLNRKLIGRLFGVMALLVLFAGAVEVGARGHLHFVKRTSEWSVSVFEGEDLASLRPIGGRTTPLLSREDVTDVDAEYVADPFMVQSGDKWYMFFEVKNRATNQGDIGLAESDDGRDWTYRGIVLDEPYHLAYPYTFMDGDDHYMVPMHAGTNALRLYRATSFPTSWEYVGDIMRGVYYDASLFQYSGRWWIMSAAHPNDWSSLHLYSSESLLGDWIEHPKSPIVTGDSSSARGAGRIIVREGQLVRFAQDCREYYGKAVWAFRVTELNADSYREEPFSDSPILIGGKWDWCSRGMHHVDAHRLPDGTWRASVDGFRRRTSVGFFSR